MPARHSRPGAPSVTSPSGGPSGRHLTDAIAPRTFAGTPLTVAGITRDAMGASSLLGSSIPKGLGAAAIGAAHAGAANTLTGNESSAQVDIATVLAQIDAISKSRSLRSVMRNAEGVAPRATQLSIESPRLFTNGRGPRVAVMGMVPGDIATAVAEFDRYGYTVNRAMTPPRMDPMTSRSYWEFDEITLIGELPQSSRDEITTAFQRGVTVWTNVAEIGQHTTNTANAGVSY